MVTINGNNIKKAKQGWVIYKKISKGQFPEEYIVTFKTRKGEITAIFSSSYINNDKKAVSASVIAEEKDSFLVDLPTYTFTTGSKVWFPKKDVVFA
jgi:hypothetical protein